MSVSFLLMTARESQNHTGNKTDIKATGELRVHQLNLFAEEVWDTWSWEKEKDSSKLQVTWTQLIFPFHFISFKFVEIFFLGNSP